jgi:RING-box protein 1
LFLSLAQQAKPTAAGAKPAPRFEIKKWNAVAMWSWDICADTVSLSFSW